MAALADSFKEIVAAQGYFSQDDLIENYFDYREIINNWRAQPYDPEELTVAANLQGALSDELSRVLLMQLNEKKEDVFFKLDLLNNEDSAIKKNELEETFTFLNDKDIEDWKKLEKLEDTVKDFNDINRQFKESDKKTLQVYHLSKLLDTYRKDLELHKKKINAQWVDRIKEGKYGEKTGNLGAKVSNCSAALEITKKIKDDILKNKNLSSEEKIKQFTGKLNAKKSTLEAAYKEKTKTFFQRIKEFLFPEKNKMNTHAFFKKAKATLKCIKKEAQDKNIEVLRNFRLMR
ncbi:hypothetical protein FOG18_02710 [Legionella israelensis]|uniref:hypothetical protein n=1 Tax=Legionella israelensis TaxID=454 RepID=UPI00117BE233|nr:hypothetical protein [Legionella israelensis]QDP71561.1 hypothetical protein FOG18_02710 [Legionella israelensis]